MLQSGDQPPGLSDTDFRTRGKCRSWPQGGRDASAHPTLCRHLAPWWSHGGASKPGLWWAGEADMLLPWGPGKKSRPWDQGPYPRWKVAANYWPSRERPLGVGALGDSRHGPPSCYDLATGLLLAAVSPRPDLGQRRGTLCARTHIQLTEPCSPEHPGTVSVPPAQP